jgi:hypothetical protein
MTAQLVRGRLSLPEKATIERVVLAMEIEGRKACAS